MRLGLTAGLIWVALVGMTLGETFELAYSYPADQRQDIVFNLRMNETNLITRMPSYSWRIAATTTNTTVEVQTVSATRFVWFTVTASNTASGIESDFCRDQFGRAFALGWNRTMSNQVGDATAAKAQRARTGRMVIR